MLVETTPGSVDAQPMSQQASVMWVCFILVPLTGWGCLSVRAIEYGQALPIARKAAGALCFGPAEEITAM
jgi:hypothetical protein